jgi:thiamine-phosphate pyrophosphorylase
MSRLMRTATALGRRARAGKPGPRLPVLWLVTDPARTPDPLAAAARLPSGAGVIYRSFGAADAATTGWALRRLTWRKGLILLIGADAHLATAVKADGVHLPERLMGQAAALRRAHPRWRITAAAHSRPALLHALRFGVDAVVVSVVFNSHSSSAAAPLGACRFASLIRGAAAPVIALGGVNESTAPRLIGTGAAGLAAVEALARARI